MHDSRFGNGFNMCFYRGDPRADNVVIAQIIISDDTYIAWYGKTSFTDGIDGSCCKAVIKCKQGSRHFAFISAEEIKAYFFRCIIKPGACFQDQFRMNSKSFFLKCLKETG